MINVAVIGYGVVGSGVAEVIRTNSMSITARAGEEIRVKKILDIRDFTDAPDQELLTKNPDDIFLDEEISVVVETIGGARIAYEYTKKALQLGKHVVTSNKELVATHGPELLKMANEHGVSYLFEASVGGGIPIIRPLNQCLAANEIIGITGILNGTTNYILTQMRKEGMDFGDALKGAQKNGYAEADPTADIEGHDACRKIAILSSIAYNQYVDYKNIHTEGITRISLQDMQYAEAMGYAIKLIGMSKRINDKIYARVSPALVNKANPLSGVEDVFNAILVRGNAIGDAMFYGRGAGKLPTASAVVADIIDIVRHIDSGNGSVWPIPETNNMIEFTEGENRYLVRIQVRNAEEARKLVKSVFGDVSEVKPLQQGLQDEIAVVTSKMSEEELQKRMEKIRGTGSVKEIVNTIRILED